MVPNHCNTDSIIIKQVVIVLPVEGLDLRLFLKKCEVPAKIRGVGRNSSLPHTTKRRITTNLKSVNNQKCKEIKLHGTQTTKELNSQPDQPDPVGGR